MSADEPEQGATRKKTNIAFSASERALIQAAAKEDREPEWTVWVRKAAIAVAEEVVGRKTGSKLIPARVGARQSVDKEEVALELIRLGQRMLGEK